MDDVYFFGECPAKHYAATAFIHLGSSPCLNQFGSCPLFGECPAKYFTASSFVNVAFLYQVHVYTSFGEVYFFEECPAKHIAASAFVNITF